MVTIFHYKPGLRGHGSPEDLRIWGVKLSDPIPLSIFDFFSRLCPAFILIFYVTS